MYKYFVSFTYTGPNDTICFGNNIVDTNEPLTQGNNILELQKVMARDIGTPKVVLLSFQIIKNF